MQILKILVASIAILTATTGFAAGDDHTAIRKQAQKYYQDGNYKQALRLFKRLCLEVENDPKRLGSDLNQAWQSLKQLNRLNELDKFREHVIAKHAKNWRLLMAAAHIYTVNDHWGFMIGGEFERSHHRGGGKVVNSIERDRIRALQLMQQAMNLAQNDPATGEVAQFYLSFGNMLYQYGGQIKSWRLHALSDLSTLPDYEPGYGYEYGRSSAGASVDENGRPLFHHLPESWEAAATDGERWRWTHQHAVELAPGLKSEVVYAYARFLHQQFGVQTLGAYGPMLERGFQADDGQTKDPTATAYAVHTLEDTETIAKLAVGVKRFKMPSDHNFIKQLEELAGQPKNRYTADALSTLAQIYENRKQYKRAHRYWKNYTPYGRKHARERISQITGNWGRFEPVEIHPAQQRPTVEYRFRNGRNVSFKAHRIKVPQLLKDIKAYIRSKPRPMDWDRVNTNNIGWRLVEKHQTRYLGQEVARWSLKLTPDRRHWDRRVTLQLPDALEKAGAYLVVATMKDGNTARIIIWVDNTVIVKKPVKNKGLYYVADAVTGKPLANTPVEFFGYRMKRRSGSKHYTAHHLTFSRRTDTNGLIYLAPKEMPSKMQWLVTAGDGQERLAFLGFSNIWYAKRYANTYHQTKTLVMTDRPVYRPKQTVKFKLWVRKTKYDLKEDASLYAGKKILVRIHNPKNEQVYAKTHTADGYGGLAGELTLPVDAPLGVYRISHNIGGSLGGQTFRVEEYKKPEFEVKIKAPKEPVMLGEKITANIKADYYFGAPVTKATVRYKVLRHAHDSRWYPQRNWDWFYGPGYWWYGYDYPWYPGWEKWGCRMPIRQWWPRGQERQPEVVAEGETQIGADGTHRLTIDTAMAKLIHGDSDHRYTIQAEVRDLSRRTIVATGEVLVARRPFRVYAWVDRGHYRVGNTVKANFKAQTLNQNPVTGTGELKLLRVSYHDGQPAETEVQTWKLNTNEQGKAQIQIQASRPGQYRLAYTVTDVKGHRIEGGYIFNVRGKGGDETDFRFAKIELIPEKTQYAAGDTARLMINTDRAGAAVLLFVRPANGVYQPPQVLQLSGKSTIQEISVAKKDMPNFFIEALTVYDGKVYTELRQIVVPPEKRVLKVDVKPSKKEYRPGEKAKMQLALSDRLGKPFTGEAVITVYDRSVDYISGGSNVPDIRSFFWKWRRHHAPQTQSSLTRRFHNLLEDNEIPMGNIGVFGDLLAETETDKALLGSTNKSEAQALSGNGMRLRMAKRKSAAAPAPSSIQKKMPMEKTKVVQKQPRAEPDPAVPVVRSQFADTAFWTAGVRTDDRGIAEVAFDIPENLTAWKTVVWAMGHGTKVGQQIVEVVTRKDLILRLQAPRFFVEKDEVVLSANVHNYLDIEKKVKVRLEFEGECLERMSQHAATQTVNIDTNGEARVNWRVRVRKEGEAVVRMVALTDTESDAMQMRFPVLVHGMKKQVPKSGVIRPEQTGASIHFNVPAERRVAQSRLELRYSPTLAGAMVDALPYLTRYPYGCTEQTLNRFLPTVITQKTLQKMGLNLADIKAKRSNLNAQEIGNDKNRSAQWQRYDENPVFDDAKVAEMITAGVKRLTAMQLSDGGWGWFSGYGEHAYPHTTAVVVHGLQIARGNGGTVSDQVVKRGITWLKKYQVRELARLRRWDKTKKKGKSRADNLDALIYMVLVDANASKKAMREYLYRDRNHLAVYAKAMFGMALHKVKDTAKLDMILKNIEQYLVEDDENQTAWLKLPNSGHWWYWYGSEYEAHGYYLKLLARTAPKSRKAARLVKYLLNNRKHATYWNSTRDTAIIVEAFADYIAASGEANPDMTVDIRLDGRTVKTVKIDKTNLFTFDNKWVLTGADITTGEHTLEIKKSGKGPLYFNAYLDYFSLEDFITREGLEIKVQRRVFKLEETDKRVRQAGSRGQAVDKKVEHFHRRPLKNMDTLKSGDQVEIELIIESKNDYEYLVFEDMKAAGFEPVDVRSGYTGNEMGAYVEFRDQKVCFFVRQLARGRHSVSYRMRAEIPGKFSALPTRAYAMYAPELKANSDEIKLTIID